MKKKLVESEYRFFISLIVLLVVIYFCFPKTSFEDIMFGIPSSLYEQTSALLMNFFRHYLCAIFYFR